MSVKQELQAAAENQRRASGRQSRRARLSRANRAKFPRRPSGRCSCGPSRNWELTFREFGVLFHHFGGGEGFVVGADLWKVLGKLVVEGMNSGLETV